MFARVTSVVVVYQLSKIEDVVICYMCNQVMSGILVIFMALSDLMWTVLGAPHSGYHRERYDKSRTFIILYTFSMKLYTEEGWP